MKKKIINLLILILAGIVIGVLIALYQYLAHIVIHGSHKLLTSDLWLMILGIAFTFLAIQYLFFINKKMPGYYGSGIPQFEGYHTFNYEINPYKMIGLMMFNSLFAFFSCFLLGSEGPSISMGASIGLVKNKLTKEDDKEIVAVGGSAGFACAFSSPLAGFIHLLEENKKIISISLILKGLLVVSISFFISYLIYPHDLLPYFDIKSLDFKLYYAFIPLILICVLVSRLFVLLNVGLKDFNKKYKIISYFTPALLVVFMILARFHPVLVGSGSNLLNPNIVDYSLIIILGILVFRIIATAVSANTSISGGIVLPTLALGAIAADLIAKILGLINPSFVEYTDLFIICGMLATFACVTKAPITALVLGLKCASLKLIILPLIITIGFSYLIIVIFKCENLYHKLEKRLPGYIEH